MSKILIDEATVKLALEALQEVYLGSRSAKHDEAITALRESLAEQPAPMIRGDIRDGLVDDEPAQQEPVAFLANGTRFKISYDSRQSGGQIHGIPPELGGRWVAFVAADDDCHLKLTSPPAQRTWVGLTHDEYDAICDKHSAMSDFDFLDDIEAKLKEKNT